MPAFPALRSAALPLGLSLALFLGSPMAAFAAGERSEDLAAALQRDRQAMQRVEARLADAKAAYLDVPIARATVSLSMAKMAFDTASLLTNVGRDLVEAKNWLARGEAYVREAEMNLMPSRGAEARGMLIDAGSMPKTEAGVIALVDQLAEAHFNVIVPEVFRRGYTVYDSRFTDRDPEFKGAPDLLKVLVREAHKRGMEVQPWIWTFRVKSPGFGNPVLSRLPALAARAEGKESRFLSAASPQAREFVYGLIGELIDRYDVDGLLLDYIRYDEEIPEDEISWTQFALDYQARNGKLPSRPVPPKSALMVEWQLWREQQVNTAVQEISRLLKARRPHFPLAVAVFRGESYSRLAKMQHWRHWSNNRWIDWASPMLYTAKTEELDRWIGWETDKRTRRNLLYPILGAHRFDSPDNLLSELGYLNRENAPGAMVFALAHFDRRLLTDLRQGPFREVASLPHRNLTRATRRTLAQAGGYMAHVFAQADFDTAASARVLHQEVMAVANSLPLTEQPYWQNAALIERVRKLQQLAGLVPLPEPVRAEFSHRLDYAIQLARANQFQLEGARYVPTSLPPIRIQPDQTKGPAD